MMSPTPVCEKAISYSSLSKRTKEIKINSRKSGGMKVIKDGHEAVGLSLQHALQGTDRRSFVGLEPPPDSACVQRPPIKGWCIGACSLPFCSPLASPINALFLLLAVHFASTDNDYSMNGRLW